MSTRFKVNLSIIILIILCILMGSVNIISFKRIAEDHSSIKKLTNLSDIFNNRIIDHLKWNTRLSDKIYSGKAADIETDPDKCALGKWYNNFLETNEYRALTPDLKEKLETLNIPHRNLHQTAVKINDHIQKGKTASASSVYQQETREHLDSVQKIIFSINNELTAMNVLANKSSKEFQGSIMDIIIWTIIASIILGAVIFIITYKCMAIMNRIKPFTKVFSDAAMGDLTINYPVKQVNCSEIMKCGNKNCPDFGRDGVLCWFDVGSYAPEFGKDIHCPKIKKGIYKSCKECQVYKSVNTDEIMSLASWFNKFILIIHDSISQVVSSSNYLYKAVEQISISNQTLSKRAAEQASTLEEIASAIEQATTAIGQNAWNAIEANKMADNTFTLADEGNGVVSKAVDSINDINDSSQKIGEIISLINDIAFQTNLLALNASVEAARAGEQGRGFAVVAGEVRNLAQRSSGAAKEIEGLIKDSIEKVITGVSLSNRSRESLVNIVEAMEKTRQLINDIADSSNEQKTGANQINSAIIEMNAITQENTAIIEETSAASEEIANQAGELMVMVKRFRISGKKEDNSEKQNLVNSD